MVLAQILSLALSQGEILLPGATLCFGRSRWRPKQTVTLSDASLLFGSDTNIYRVWLWTPPLHVHMFWNKHWSLKIARNDASLFLSITPVGVSSSAQWFKWPRASLWDSQPINMKPLLWVASELQQPSVSQGCDCTISAYLFSCFFYMSSQTVFNDSLPQCQSHDIQHTVY